MGKIEIRDLSAENMWFVASCTHLDDYSEEREVTRQLRAEYLTSMREKGLRVKVAHEGDRPVGFIQYLPIEHAARDVTGRNLILIHCLVSTQPGKGYGRALLQAAGDDAAAKSDGITLEAYQHDFWYMPASFFLKHGYREVARKGIGQLLLKSFHPGVELPRYLEPRFELNPVLGKVAVDVFYTPLCPVAELLRVRRVCTEYGDKVLLRQHNAGQPEVRKKWGIVRAIFFNGKGRCGGDVATEAEIRSGIEAALADKGPFQVEFDPDSINHLF